MVRLRTQDIDGPVIINRDCRRIGPFVGIYNLIGYLTVSRPFGLEDSTPFRLGKMKLSLNYS